MNIENIPQELRDLPHWVARTDKVPISPHNLYGAKANDPKTWGTFEQACSCVGKRARTGQLINGIGFELRAPYCGIDIDNCVDAVTGEISSEAMGIISVMDSYTELSPSKTGIHILYKNDGNTHPDRHKKKPIKGDMHIEMYQSDRYFTVTGDILGDHNKLNERTEQAELIYKSYMVEDQPADDKNVSLMKHSDYPDATLSEDEILRKARSSKNGAAFSRLWSGDTSDYDCDDSRADLALCNMLAFWTGCDAEKMDSLFRQSGLYRSKWDRQQSGTTYGAITIQKAIAGCTDVYKPGRQSDDYSITIGSDAAVKHQERAIPELPEFTYEDIKRHTPDDAGAAELFADLVRPFLCFVPEAGTFFIYNGVIWEKDAIKRPLKTVKLLIKFKSKAQRLIPPPLPDTVGLSAEQKAEEQLNKAYRKYYANLGNSNVRDRVLRDSQALLEIPYDSFDTQPCLLNCHNGTYNLDTDVLQPHRASDMLTRCVNADYDPEAVNERFNSFIDETCESKSELKTALQTALGYTLIGATPEECFFIAYGKSTRNGKGTLFDLVLDTLGDYGVQMDFNTIARSGSKDGSRPTPDLARLAGIRYVLINEPQKGICFNEGLIKQMTGSDNITARPMYGDPVEYKPRFTIYIESNNLPAVSDDTLFTSDRIRILPFNRHLSREERDPFLKAKLREGNGREAVLNWLIEGYRMYREHGLQETSAEKKIIGQYREDNDYVGQFINECLIVRDQDDRHSDTERITNIMARYNEWCRCSNLKALGPKHFREELEKHGLRIIRLNGQYKTRVTIRPYSD